MPHTTTIIIKKRSSDMITFFFLQSNFLNKIFNVFCVIINRDNFSQKKKKKIA